MWHENVYVSLLVWNVLNNRSQRKRIHYEFQGLKGRVFWSGGSLVKFRRGCCYAALDQTGRQVGFYTVGVPSLPSMAPCPSPQTSQHLPEHLDLGKTLPALGLQEAQNSQVQPLSPLSSQCLNFLYQGGCMIAVFAPDLSCNAHRPDPGDWPVWIQATGFLSFWFSLGLANGSRAVGERSLVNISLAPSLGGSHGLCLSLYQRP